MMAPLELLGRHRHVPRLLAAAASAPARPYETFEREHTRRSNGSIRDPPGPTGKSRAFAGSAAP